MPSKALVCIKVIAVPFSHHKLNLICLVLISPGQETGHRSDNPQLATLNLC